MVGGGGGDRTDQYCQMADIFDGVYYVSGFIEKN
jgi:hypothetical protein